MRTTAFELPFATQPDLAATMDIQIPALAWQPTGSGGYRRVVHLDDHPVTVEVTEVPGALRITADRPHSRLVERMRAMFPTQIADLDLGTDPQLAALRDRYAGVVVMWAAPFEALVLTVLSQNRTGEIVRRVYPTLDQVCGGLTPSSLAGVDTTVLRATIRSAGPYKADRLTQLAVKVAADGDTFHTQVLTAPVEEALAYLEALPGVAHKTAACVLVFAARTRATLPVDVHLFRVADRLGLAAHDGRLTATSRRQVIGSLLAHGPDLALAHFVFLLVGRTTCIASEPACPACFLRTGCPYATRLPPHPEEATT